MKPITLAWWLYESLKALALTSCRAATRQCPENRADCVLPTSHHASEQWPQCGDPVCLDDGVERAADGQNGWQRPRHKAVLGQYGKRLMPPENAQRPSQPLVQFSHGEFVPSVHTPVPWLIPPWRQ